MCLCDHGFGFLSIVVKASGTFYPLSAFSCGGAGTGLNPGSSSSSSSSTCSTSLGKVGGLSRSSRGTSPSPPSPPQSRGAIITVPNNETSSEGRNRQHYGTGAWGSCSVLSHSNDILTSLPPVLCVSSSPIPPASTTALTLCHINCCMLSVAIVLIAVPPATPVIVVY